MSLESSGTETLFNCGTRYSRDSMAYWSLNSFMRKENSLSVSPCISRIQSLWNFCPMKARAETICSMLLPNMDMANRTFDLAKIPNKGIISVRMESSRLERWVTAWSKAFWQKAELYPGTRRVFSSFRISGSFLSFFTSCRKIPGVLSRIRISRFTSSVKAETMCSRTERFPAFGFPYRNTLLVTGFWHKESSFQVSIVNMSFL